ncbi:MAG: hypothetical protein H3Z52_16370 [archaeon]|nr:hypothetical protein [archaeon]
MVEHDANLDLKYFHNFLWRTRIGSVLFEATLRLRDKPDQIKKKKEVIELITEKTGVPTEIIEEMFTTRQRWPDTEMLQRTMANEIESWQKVLGKERLEHSLKFGNIQGLTTRLYTLPNKSTDFVRRSWKRWQG